ncbi:MAG: argininosuccinate lyase, partial [Verrucomicrobia bacterium]|nr:argininosuccinate lyase [Verrucomicrobiota bacterium]
MTYNRDLQEDKEAVFDSLDQIKTVLEVYIGMLGELELNETELSKATSDPMLLATDLADYLVLRGIPFRQAHEIIGKLVAYSVKENRGLNRLRLEEFQRFSDRFESDVFGVLDLDRALASRVAIGAPSPQNVAAELAAWEQRLNERA